MKLKKLTYAFSSLTLALAMPMFAHTALADTSSTSTDVRIEDRGDHGEDQSWDGSKEQEMDQEARDVEDAQSQEAGVHRNVSDVQDKISTFALPNVESSKWSTYGDVITQLNAFRSTLEDLKNAASTTAPAAALDPQHQALLDKLINLHGNHFQSLNARIAEVEGQIQELVDLLTPFADQQIADADIRAIIASDVRGIRDEMKSLKSLSHDDFEVVDQEAQ